MSGRLVLVPTPIGNLQDITLRALDVLRSADLVAAEDTRHTRKLLSRFAVPAKLVAYHQHNENAQLPYLLDRVRAGDTVALVSDAGTPGIADAGHRLVVACLEEGLTVDVLPGPSAVVTALVQSGLPTARFAFLGWFARVAKERSAMIDRIAATQETVVLYESPKRLAATLDALAAVLPERPAAVARELTKLHQEVIRGTLAELARRVGEAGEVKGEIVVVIGPAQAPGRGEVDADAVDAVVAREAAGESVRDAVRVVAAERGVPRRALYEAVLVKRKAT